MVKPIESIGNRIPNNAPQKMNVLSYVFYLLAETSLQHHETARATAEGVQENIKAIRDLTRRLESVPQVTISPELRTKIAAATISNEELMKISTELSKLQLEWSMASAIGDHIQTTIAGKRQEGDIQSTQLNTTTQQLSQTLQTATSTSKANLDLTRALLR